MRLTLTESLLARLREDRAATPYTDDIMESEDAFVLYPGMGSAIYLTSDGRVLIDERDWKGEPVREATDDEACTGLVLCADAGGISELLDLLPTRPAHSSECFDCRGQRYLDITLPSGKHIRPICGRCWGRGWIPLELN